MAKPLLYIGNGSAKSGGVGPKSHASHQAVRAIELAREGIAFFLEPRDFRSAGHGAIHKFLMIAPRLVQIVAWISGQDGFAQKIKHHGVNVSKRS